MAIIWETTDRFGRPVALTEKGWEHVLFEHDYMVHRIQEVQDAVTSADEIVRDRKFAHREIHYRAQGSGRRWLRVVIHYRPRNPSGWTGEAITAHLVNRRSHEEAHLWPLKTLN